VTGVPFEGGAAVTGAPVDPGHGVTAGRAGLDALVAGLPGLSARDVTRFKAPSDGSGRRGGVLMLFGEDGPGGTGRGLDLVLIERAATMRSHAGQPAFPGGAVDPTDVDVVAAALREAEEEVGVDPAGVEVVGCFPELFLPASRFLVTPVVGWWREPHVLRVGDPAEVALVGRVAVADLADPARRWTLTHPSGHIGPAFDVVTAAGDPMLVWGFTAGVISSLLRVGGWERPWDAKRLRALPDDVVQAAVRSSPGWPSALPPEEFEEISDQPGEVGP
jgi:8-oxo-dGTP pyrophosphatase MutT (NUDIX family)